MKTRKLQRVPEAPKDEQTAKWTKPPPGWSKLNVDGAWKDGEPSGGTGMVLRDDAGNIIFTACHHLFQCEGALEAELRACEEGLSLAMQWTDKPIVLESDCRVAVDMINEKGVNRSPVAALVNSIRRHFMGDRMCKVVHVSRKLNGVSHILAKLGHTKFCTKVWLRSRPDEIHLACIQDDTPIS
jgi:ribonuclease HI